MIWQNFAAFSLPFALCACGSSTPLFVKKPSAPKTLQEGVSVSTSVVYIRPWAELADSLSPKFANTPDNALSNVLGAQSFSDFRLLQSLGISAQAGVQLDPVSAVTDEAVRKLATKTTGDVTETVSDTTDRTVTTKSVDDNSPPATADLPAARSGSATALADQIGATRTPGTEPLFRYSTAAALYQEIGLLNDAVAGIPGFAGKKPYIIRLRVGVLPYRRDLEWDVYAHLMLADGVDTVGAPQIVLPILSSEAFEGTMDASALQQINELRLGIQALAANAKISGGISRLNDNLTQFLSRSYSPSLQVTGTSGLSIDVKFGASRDRTGYALTSRNFYVTVVAYLDEPLLNGSPKRYRFHTQYEARDAKKGQLVKSDTKSYFQRADAAVARANIVLPEGCDGADLIFRYIEYVNLYGGGAAKELQANYGQCTSPDTLKRLGKYDFMLDALAARRMVEKSSFPLELQPRRAAFLSGAVPLVQESAEGLVVDIPYSGPDELPLGRLRAQLVDNGGMMSLSPRLVTLKSSGAQRLVHLEFPPLSAFKSEAIAPSKGGAKPIADPRQKPQGWSVVLTLAPQATSEAPIAFRASLANGYVATATKAATPDFAFSTPVRSARLGADGLLSFSVQVKPPENGKIKLSAKDAELIENGAPVGDLTISTAGTRSITLRNAMPGQTVTLTATATLDADSKAKAETSVAVLVQPPLTSK
ncbi:hypothetical protein [Sphingomonas crocodyli]|uniref:Uncharacterized protein n=1 Tax=Sphingomonas crocodyli TaxID=1979270 RepID=A0A437M6X6_9SPHN|nr:hypothetical protein [Sphingomonas crocodyli]RVT93468.1 hypothetical protein EOD43_06215 [Sphingomonas crocodyli]